MKEELPWCYEVWLQYLHFNINTALLVGYDKDHCAQYSMALINGYQEIAPSGWHSFYHNNGKSVRESGDRNMFQHLKAQSQLLYFSGCNPAMIELLGRWINNNWVALSDGYWVSHSICCSSTTRARESDRKMFWPCQVRAQMCASKEPGSHNHGGSIALRCWDW